MLTLAVFKENPEAVIERLKVKNFDARTQIERIIELDKVRRNRQQARDKQAAELNKMAAAIGALMKQGKKDEAEEAKAKVAELKENNKAIDEELKTAEDEITSILLNIPNMPCDMDPLGTSAEDNVVEKEGGAMPELGEDALPHWDLA